MCEHTIPGISAYSLENLLEAAEGFGVWEQLKKWVESHAAWLSLVVLFWWIVKITINCIMIATSLFQNGRHAAGTLLCQVLFGRRPTNPRREIVRTRQAEETELIEPKWKRTIN